MHAVEVKVKQQFRHNKLWNQYETFVFGTDDDEDKVKEFYWSLKFMIFKSQMNKFKDEFGGNRLAVVDLSIKDNVSIVQSSINHELTKNPID